MDQEIESYRFIKRHRACDFDLLNISYRAPVAQLDRASDFGSFLWPPLPAAKVHNPPFFKGFSRLKPALRGPERPLALIIVATVLPQLPPSKASALPLAPDNRPEFPQCLLPGPGRSSISRVRLNFRAGAVPPTVSRTGWDKLCRAWRLAGWNHKRSNRTARIQSSGTTALPSSAYVCARKSWAS